MQVQELNVRYLACLAREKQAIAAKMERLEKQGCGDDAMLERIRLNICDVFAAVAKTGENQTKGRGEGAEAFVAFCKARFASIPAAWQAHLEAAAAHGDLKAQAIETVKLETAARLQSIFTHLTEEA